MTMPLDLASTERVLREATNIRQITESSAYARKRLIACRSEPLFLADWERTVFIHYEVDPEALQRQVPFELDLCAGRAYVSLVAFTMRRLHPRCGGLLGAWLFKPVGTNEYLNVRTYVRHRGESGIYFLAEWLNNRLSVPLGPLAFGLPHRFGRLDYHHHHESGEVCGEIRESRSQSCIAYRASLPTVVEFKPCLAGSLDEFLLERYTAFTQWKSHRRFFRIWHPPWPQTPIDLSELEDGLLATTGEWRCQARFVGGNYSPGVRNVWMGRPHRARL